MAKNYSLKAETGQLGLADQEANPQTVMNEFTPISPDPYAGLNRKQRRTLAAIERKSLRQVSK